MRVEQQVMGGGEMEEVWVREGPGGDWGRCQARLDEEGAVLVEREGRVQRLVALSAEHYVGDSRVRDHAFLVSDLDETVYFAAVSEDAKHAWMQRLASLLRRIGTLRKQNAAAPRPDGPVPLVAEPRPPSAAQRRLEIATARYEIACRQLELLARVRSDAEARANKSQLTHEEIARKEAEAAAAEKARRLEEERIAAERKAEAETQKRLDKIREERERRSREEAEQLVQQKHEQQERKRLSAQLPSGGIRAGVQAWTRRVDEYSARQKENPFSDKSDGGGGQGLRPGEVGYGQAREGTKTAERAKAAKAWVEKEIDKFLGVVQNIGAPGPEGHMRTTFGELFLAYQDISDSLVGIMMRAKKRRLIAYDGDMLFQGMHDDVQVVVTAEGAKRVG